MNVLLMLIGLGIALYGGVSLARGEVSTYRKADMHVSTYSREENPGRFYALAIGYLVTGLVLGGLMLWVIQR